jgi:predicted secreted protein
MNDARKLFSIYTLDNAGAMTLLCGLQSTSVTISQEAADTTDNCSNGQRQMLQGAGVRSLSIAGSGISRNFNSILAAHTQNQQLYTLVTNETGQVFAGFCHISSIALSGTHNGADLFDIALESSSQVQYIAPNPSILTDEFGAPIATESGAVFGV